MQHEPKATIILNGTKVWFAAIGFLIIHGGAGIWWAATLNKNVQNIDSNLTQLVTTVESNRKEAKEDNKELRKEFLRVSRKS